MFENCHSEVRKENILTLPSDLLDAEASHLPPWLLLSLVPIRQAHAQYAKNRGSAVTRMGSLSSPGACTEGNWGFRRKTGLHSECQVTNRPPFSSLSGRAGFCLGDTGQEKEFLSTFHTVFNQNSFLVLLLFFYYPGFFGWGWG